MPRPKGSISQANREKLIEAQRMRRVGTSYAAIAKHLGLSTTTVKRWAASGLLALDEVQQPREVLETLMLDPSPHIRLRAATALYGMERADSADEAAPTYDAVEYRDDEPPDGHDRPYAILQIWQ